MIKNKIKNIRSKNKNIWKKYVTTCIEYYRTNYRKTLCPVPPFV